MQCVKGTRTLQLNFSALWPQRPLSAIYILFHMQSPKVYTTVMHGMEVVEERALTNCPLPPPPWKQYVNDTFIAFLEDEVDQFFDHLNMVEPTIKFTMERESNGPLTFLEQFGHPPPR